MVDLPGLIERDCTFPNAPRVCTLWKAVVELGMGDGGKLWMYGCGLWLLGMELREHTGLQILLTQRRLLDLKKGLHLCRIVADEKEVGGNIGSCPVFQLAWYG